MLSTLISVGISYLLTTIDDKNMQWCRQVAFNGWTNQRHPRRYLGSSIKQWVGLIGSTKETHDTLYGYCWTYIPIWISYWLEGHYVSFVCDHWPLKTEPWRVWLVAGGDKLPYNAYAEPPASKRIETKNLPNSPILDA